MNIFIKQTPPSWRKTIFDTRTSLARSGKDRFISLQELKNIRTKNERPTFK
jgi:hypothetical protein